MSLLKPLSNQISARMFQWLSTALNLNECELLNISAEYLHGICATRAWHHQWQWGAKHWWLLPLQLGMKAGSVGMWLLEEQTALDKANWLQERHMIGKRLVHENHGTNTWSRTNKKDTVYEDMNAWRLAHKSEDQSAALAFSWRRRPCWFLHRSHETWLLVAIQATSTTNLHSLGALSYQVFTKLLDFLEWS